MRLTVCRTATNFSATGCRSYRWSNSSSSSSVCSATSNLYTSKRSFKLFKRAVYSPNVTFYLNISNFHIPTIHSLINVRLSRTTKLLISIAFSCNTLNFNYSEQNETFFVVFFFHSSFFN